MRLCAVLALAGLVVGTALGHGPARALGPESLTVAVGAVPIHVDLYRPAGPGPHPVLVLSHGSPRRPEERSRPIALAPQARPFVDRGFLVLVPSRRGYGATGGAWVEGYGPCSDPDYVRAGRATAADIRAAAEAGRALPGADRDRVVLVGHSAGGWGSLAAAAEGVPGLVGVVSFAGGRGSSGPDSVCGAERLVAAAAAFGGTTRVPGLWIYARNDRFFGPDLAGSLHRAFTGAGGRAELAQVPASGTDGHGHFLRATAEWLPAVDAFLRRVGAMR